MIRIDHDVVGFFFFNLTPFLDYSSLNKKHHRVVRVTNIGTGPVHFRHY